MTTFRTVRGVLALVAGLLISPLIAAQCEPTPEPSVATAEVEKVASLPSCPGVTIEWAQNHYHSALIVDARAQNPTKSVRIADAVPVDQALVQAKHRSVLVVGSGWNSDEEQRACNRLAEAGFMNIAVLTGGARAWVRAGLPTWTSAVDVQSLDEMTPVEAHAAAVRGDVDLFVVREQGLPIACPADVEHIHCVESWKDVEDGVRQCASEQVVVVASDDQRRASVDDLQSVMSVNGGVDAMRRHFEQYRSMAQSAGQSLWIPCHRR